MMIKGIHSISDITSNQTVAVLVVFYKRNNDLYESQNVKMYLMIECMQPRPRLAYSVCSLIRPRGYKTFFMLNSVEHEICLADKYQITKHCNFFLAKHG